MASLKCSTCLQFVPLEKLGDHICNPSPSPVRPLSPNTSQSRASPVPKPPANGSNSLIFQPRPSPLAVGSRPMNAGPSRATTPLSINTSSMGPRPRVPSNASVNQQISIAARPTAYSNHPSGSPSRSTPSLVSVSSVPASNIQPLGYRAPPRRPSISPSGTPTNMVPPPDMGSPAPQKIGHSIGPGVIIPEQSFVPPPERGINTKTGGEAGMAGVGRRGFAAVTRAAMFALPTSQPLGSRRPDQPKYLDLDAVSRSSETPPLSPGSGYSSHSPGPMSPLPQSEFPSQPVATKISTPTQSESLKPADPVNSMTSLTSPLSTRFPFFEKFKNKKMPANDSTSDSAHTANNDPPLSSLITPVRTKTSDGPLSIEAAMLYRSITSSTSSSVPIRDVRQPISPIDSESDYGGLAYASSTDYQDDDGRVSRSLSKNSSRPDFTSYILRTGSNSSSRRHRRPSGSEHSDNNTNDRTGILIGSTRPRPGHSRNASASTVSSGGSSLSRANSATIAQALGLSQTLPSDYKKLGGPMGGMGRSRSGRRNAGPDSMEEMKKALEEAKIKARSKQPSFGSSSQRSQLDRANTTSTNASSRKDDDVIGSPGGGLKAHRSNSTQSPRPNSPESKPVKLPMRAMTSPKLERDKALDGTSVRKERARKAKVCLKCRKVVDNGRWVLVDGGGVLCERCWKNMYLPKCRRCNLSIEKQAVSSSDGQLKGKYHKECFNCDTCYKPFPDKTFYVYDGKPLCAYHYHEANDSLCAASRCGQPIEGPCAVSHSGDRYHPEHMTCEHPGHPPCKQMLSEYWEIDGRMLCERHANSASVRDGSDEEDEGWAKSKKRVTRFIELAGGFGGTELGDHDDSGLR